MYRTEWCALDTQVFLSLDPFFSFWCDIDVALCCFFVGLYCFLNLSYAVQLITYMVKYPKLLDVIIVILIRSENPTIPKDCNFICCKCDAYIKPMHRSYITFMYLFYVLFRAVMYFTELHLWLVNLGTFLNIAYFFPAVLTMRLYYVYLMVPTGQNRHTTIHVGTG